MVVQWMGLQARAAQEEGMQNIGLGESFHLVSEGAVLLPWTNEAWRESFLTAGRELVALWADLSDTSSADARASQH